MSSHTAEPKPSFFITLRNKTALFLDEHRLLGIQSGLIIAALLVCVGIGFLSSKIDTTWYLIVLSAAPLLVFVVGLVLDRPQWIPLFILLLAAFMPFSLPTGTQSRLVFSLVLTILFVSFWLLKMFIIDKKFSLLPSKLNLPLLGFMAAVVISLVWGNLFRDPYVIIWPTFPVVQVASAVVLIMLPAVFLATYNHINDLNVVKGMVAVMMVAGVLGLIRMYGDFDHFPVNTNGMFNLWVISLSFSLAVFNRKAPAWLRIFFLLLAAAWVVWSFVLHIDWLAGWVPGLIAIGIICLFRSRKFVVLIALAAVIIFLFKLDYFVDFIQSEYAWSGATRLRAWAHNWLVTRNHWLFGTGPAGYMAYYKTYWPTYIMATHNNYIDIFSQNGIVGLFFCLLFFFRLTRNGLKTTLRFNRRFDFWESVVTAIFAGLIAVILIMAFGDWMFPFAYTQTISGYDHAVYSWLFLSLLPVIDRLIPDLKKENQNAAAVREN